jgi:uncharacterized membrane protein YesL
MGLFSFNYDKEGPGIDKNAPKKGPVGEFFSILGTKFWRLVQINLLLVLFSIPALLVSFFVVNWLVPNIMPSLTPEHISKLLTSVGLGEALVENLTVEAFASHLFVSTMLVFTAGFVGVQLFTVGPVHAGLTYLMRNISRREPAFTWMDFKDTAKSNLKQSIIHSIITALLGIVIGVAYYYYARVMAPSVFKTIMQTFMVVIFILFLIMQMYCYQLMITFDLKLKDVYRNAFLMTFLKLPSNFFTLLLNVLILFVIPYLAIWLIPHGLTNFILLIFYLFLLFSLTLFISNYQANRQIQRYLMPPDDDDDDNEGGLGAETAEFLDEEDTEPDKKSGRVRVPGPVGDDGEDAPEEDDGPVGVPV